MGTPRCGQFHDVKSERYCPDCISIGLWERLIEETRRGNDLMEMKGDGEEQPRRERKGYQESTYKPPEPQVPKVVRRTQ